MKYKTGDTVWYIDRSVVPIPRVKSSKVSNVLTDEELYEVDCSIWDYLREEYLFPTKEALLAAIDPTLHNFTVGQTVWYIEEADDPNTLRVEKAVVISTTNDTVEVNISHPCVPNFIIEDLDIIFASPRDAVNKALELKQW